MDFGEYKSWNAFQESLAEPLSFIGAATEEERDEAFAVLESHPDKDHVLDYLFRPAFQEEWGFELGRNGYGREWFNFGAKHHSLEMLAYIFDNDRVGVADAILTCGGKRIVEPCEVLFCLASDPGRVAEIREKTHFYDPGGWFEKPVEKLLDAMVQRDEKAARRVMPSIHKINRKFYPELKPYLESSMRSCFSA